MRLKQSNLTKPDFEWSLDRLGYHVTMQLFAFKDTQEYVVNIIKEKDGIKDKQAYPIDHSMYIHYCMDCFASKGYHAAELEELAHEQELIAATCTDERIKKLHLNAAECYRNKNKGV